MKLETQAIATHGRIADMVSMRALECLVAIVEPGSLTRAAAVLHMSQPACRIGLFPT